MTASKLHEIVLFASQPRQDGNNKEALPTRVIAPEDELMPVFGEAPAAEVGRRSGACVEMVRWKHGSFEDASISVITTDTVSQAGRLAGCGSPRSYFSRALQFMITPNSRGGRSSPECRKYTRRPSAETS